MLDTIVFGRGKSKACLATFVEKNEILCGNKKLVKVKVLKSIKNIYSR